VSSSKPPKGASTSEVSSQSHQVPVESALPSASLAATVPRFVIVEVGFLCWAWA
jgi:hypothetical protein